MLHIYIGKYYMIVHIARWYSNSPSIVPSVALLYAPRLPYTSPSRSSTISDSTEGRER